MEAFGRVMRRLPKITRHLIETENVRIEDRIDELISLFGKRKHCLFEELFEDNKPLSWFIITFMAMLEMVRLHLITIVQVDQLGAIHCAVHDDFDQNISRWYHLQNTNGKEETLLLKAS
jgi:segregation and condensation protein A